MSPLPITHHVQLWHTRKVSFIPRHYRHFKGQSRRGNPEVVCVDQQAVILRDSSPSPFSDHLLPFVRCGVSDLKSETPLEPVSEDH